MALDARRAWARTLVGRTLAGRYTIERLLDVGGMGAVFEGVHRDVRRKVAIKTLVPGALDEVQTERMRREARQAAAAAGRGVVDVMDFGVDAECGPFLVMELLSGETLAARLARGRLSIDEAIRLGDEALATLARVHARGLVHRDLKPANLFLAREEGVEVLKILDFGIARPRSAEDALTASGAIVGTPRFMSPEQARGEDAIDPRVDVYAMGAVLYAMISGHRPYEELDGADAVRAAAAGPPRPLVHLAPSAPAALLAVIERAMAQDPADRYPDAGAMRAALLALEPPVERGGDSIATVDPPSIAAARRPPAPRRRLPALAIGAALLVCAALLLGAGVYGAASMSPEAPRASPEVSPELPRAPLAVEPLRPPEPERAPAPSPIAAPPPGEPRGERTPRRAAKRTSIAPAAAEPRTPARSGPLEMEDF